jgi:hypothetical protein
VRTHRDQIAAFFFGNAGDAIAGFADEVSLSEFDPGLGEHASRTGQCGGGILFVKSGYIFGPDILTNAFNQRRIDVDQGYARSFSERLEMLGDIAHNACAERASIDWEKNFHWATSNGGRRAKIADGNSLRLIHVIFVDGRCSNSKFNPKD